MKLLHNGKVSENGRLHINNRQQFVKDLLLFSGKDITISIERRKRKRSLQQNAYYFGVVVQMVRHGLVDVGYRITLEQTHEFLKTKFLVKELINEKTGEILSTTGSTAELTTSEFMDFIAEIQQWAAEFLNIEIPDPGEQTKIEFGSNLY